MTPDSFSDGGKYFNKKRAVDRAIRMASEGADIIDVGGESTRPGARDISVREECSRVIPVIEAISKKLKISISVDTRKASVAEAAINAGACIINDVSGLRHDPGMAKVAAKYGAVVIVMHMKGNPRNMQRSPRYKNLISDIKSGLRGSIKIAKRAGVKEQNIIIDPGVGFGKTVEHNLEILNRLGEFKDLGRPICVGTSRKSFIGKILNNYNASDRLTGTIATCAVAIIRGADILRVHDVREAVEVAGLTDRIITAGAGRGWK